MLEDISEQRGWRRWGAKAALAVGGMLAGGPGLRRSMLWRRTAA